MPYIEPVIDRKHISRSLTDMPNHDRSPGAGAFIRGLAAILRNVPSGKVKGAFNYFVMRLWLCTFFPNNKVGYTSLSDAIKVFDDMKVECERRLMGPYEDYCIEKNGDLPEFTAILEKMEKADKHGLKEK